MLVSSVTLSSISAEEVIAVAAGISPCIEEIVSLWYEQGNENLAVVKGPCGALANQYIAGADFTMIIFSEPRWAEWMQGKGVHLTRVDLACHYLTLWWPREEPPQLSLADVAVIACPNPESTAYGNAACQLLSAKGRWDRAMDEKRLILVKGAPHAVTAVNSGAADAAFIPAATAILASRKGGSYTLLDTEPIIQTAVLLSDENPEAARLLEFCLSEETAPLWEKWGFTPR